MAGAVAAAAGTSVDLPAREDHEGAETGAPAVAAGGSATAAPPAPAGSSAAALAPPAPRTGSGSGLGGWGSPPPSAPAWPTAMPTPGSAGNTTATPPPSGTRAGSAELLGGLTGPTGPRRSHARRNILIAAAVVVVLIAAAAVAFVLRSHGNHKTAGQSSSPAPSAAAAAKTPVTAAAGAASTGPLPTGWRWYSVTAAAAGTNAGFKLAVPDGWLVASKGNGYYLEAPGGDTFLQVDMTPHTKYSMVAEARYLAELTQKQGKFPGYGDQTIRAANVRGFPGAAWGFTWQDPTVGRVRALDLMYIARTSAGQQSFALYMSSPVSAFDGNLATFTEEMRTFQSVP